MPRLQAIATAVPAHEVCQDSAREFAVGLFGRHFRDLDRLLPLFGNAGIEKRYFSEDLSWFHTPHTLEEKNAVYIREATALTARASRELFEKTGTAPEDIDYIIYINTTGLATPSIDARLINELGLRPNTRRTPIWGLGCAGGVAGLAHAYHYILGHPEAKVLLVAAELCGLTFMPDDPSKSNLVACALFGEGAAAALITGDTGGDGGLEMKATQSAFYPDSLNVMGWHVVSQGLQVVFDKRIPEIVANNSTAELDTLLEQNHLTRKDIARYLYHPGGMKVLDAYIKAYDAPDEAFACSRETLRDFGNMSSVTVLFVLERYLRSDNKPHGAYGVISALGPGFCSESILVRL